MKDDNAKVSELLQSAISASRQVTRAGVIKEQVQQMERISKGITQETGHQQENLDLGAKYERRGY